MVLFGVWLFLAPFWMPVHLSATSVAAWNAYVSGILVASIGWAALARPQRWERWLNLALGIWLVIAPFLLRFFVNEPAAAWNQVILGVLIGGDAIALLVEEPGRKIRA